MYIHHERDLIFMSEDKTEDSNMNVAWYAEINEIKMIKIKPTR